MLSDLSSRVASWDSAKPFNDWLQSHQNDTAQCHSNVVDIVQSGRQRGEQGIQDSLGLGKVMNLEPWSYLSHRIMDWLLGKLSFDEMFDRQERVSNVFEGTFEWIYSEPRDPERPWDSFSSWLTQDRGIYWITGKAGSGKSTLMRMLQSDARTHQLLRHWMQNDRLISSTFFFWNSGSNLQMSQEGLLRSILKQILENVLQSASDQLSRKLEAFCLSLEPSEKLSFKDLKQLFRIIIEDNYQPCRHFILIDGLDEVSGDKSTLVSLIHTLGTYKNVKICVSSRPWIVFEDGFRQNPSLMLQFLTYGDIMLYVRKKLTKQPAFRELAWGYPSEAEGLLKDITTKASGVFLWVILAVDSLIRGLADGDRIEDLQRRLGELPAELEELFNKLLHGLEGRYFADVARIFRIHNAAKKPGLGFSDGLSLLALAIAEESNFNSVVKLPFKPFSGKELLMRATIMKRRLSSRCNGFLEIEDPRRKSGEIWNARDLDRLITDAGAGDPSVLPTLHAYGRALAKTTVQYLHRTVKDYLEAPETWQRIHQAACEASQLEPDVSLCLAHIVLWKTFDSTAIPDHSGEEFTYSLFRKLFDTRESTFKRILERSFNAACSLSGRAHIQVLDVIGKSLFQENFMSSTWNRLNIMHPPKNFLSFAIRCNLSDYVNAKLSRSGSKLSAQECSHLLHAAVCHKEPVLDFTPFTEEDQDDEDSGSDPDIDETREEQDDFEIEPRIEWAGRRPPGGPDLAMVKILLRLGASPNYRINGLSSHQVVQQRIVTFERMSQDGYQYHLHVLSKIYELFGKWNEVSNLMSD